MRFIHVALHSIIYSFLSFIVIYLEIMRFILSSFYKHFSYLKFSIVNARADIYIFVHCIIRHKHSSLFDIYLRVELLGYRVNISLVELPKCLVLVTIFSSTNIVSILIAQFFASLLLFFVVVLFVFISHLVKIFAFTNFSYF